MSDEKGYYATLNVKPGSSIEECKASYSKLQREFHPDHGTAVKKARQIQDKAEREKVIADIYTKISQINEAKQTLLDEAKKQEYDTPQQAFSIFDLFGQQRNRRNKVKSTKVDVKLTMKQSFNGCSKKFKVKRTLICKKCLGKGGEKVKTCHQCNGTGVKEQRVRRGMLSVEIHRSECDVCEEGMIYDGPKCTECKGQRHVLTQEIIDVCFSKGINTGEQISYEKMGDEHMNCDTGDLLFKVTVTEDKNYKRVDNNIVASVAVPLITALGGGSIKYLHLNDVTYSIQIPRIKSFDDLVKIDGLGFPGGDLYIKPEFEVPNISIERLKTILPEAEKFSGKEIHGKFASEPVEMQQEESNDGFGGFRSFFSF